MCIRDRLYVALTLLQVLVMLMGGMTLYEALCTSFGTAGTGGFGIYGDSIARFSPFLQWAITVFMIAFGVNFNVYFLLYMRRPKDALHCEEKMCIRDSCLCCPASSGLRQCLRWRGH